jgi:FG-GAP repeat
MKKKFRSALLMAAGATLIALCVSRVGLFSGRPVTVQETKPPLHGEPALQQLKKDGQYESLQAAVNQARFSVSPTVHSPLGGAAWRAPNPVAGYDAYVTESRVSIAISDDSKSSVSLSLHSFGYGSDLQPVGSGEVSGAGQTIQVRRSGSLQEWYVNGPDGLEQGFTLSEPPRYPVPPSGISSPLRLALKVSDGWHSVASDDGMQVNLRGPAGQTVEYGKLVVRDNLGSKIPARLTVANAQVVIEVEDSHAVYPLTIDPLFTLQRRLTATDAKTQDFFGHSVALDGNTALVGAPYDDVNHTDQGSAYVFVRNGTTWTEQAHLTAADGANLDLFGWVVALDGDTALVGAYNGPGTAGADQGAVYVFVRQGTSWSQQTRLNASDGVAAGGFGTVLALDGDTALVGAPSYRVSQILAPGAAYVFVRNGVAWTQQARLTANEGEDSDQFGAAVAVEDGTAFIGAPADDVGNNVNQGSVYVFTRNGVL